MTNGNETTQEDIEKSQMRFDLDPEKKKKFKIFCAVNDTNITEYLTAAIDQAIKTITK